MKIACLKSFKKIIEKKMSGVPFLITAEFLHLTHFLIKSSDKVSGSLTISVTTR